MMCKLTRFVVVLRQTPLTTDSGNNNKINALIVLGTYFGAYSEIKIACIEKNRTPVYVPLFYAVVF